MEQAVITLDPCLFEKTYWMLCDCYDIWEQCEGEKELKMRKLIYKLAERIEREKDDNQSAGPFDL